MARLGVYFKEGEGNRIFWEAVECDEVGRKEDSVCSYNLRENLG